MSIVFFGSGLIRCWGGYAAGFAGPKFVAASASRGFAARLWLRGVASPGFADACPAVRETFSFRTGGHGWASKGRSMEVGPRWLRGGFAEASRKRSIVSGKTGPETHSALPVVFLSKWLRGLLGSFPRS